MNLLFFIVSIFFVSCGLDEVVTVYEPTKVYNQPLYNSSDYLKWYFSFSTNETGQPSSFIGTDVYYKIYNNYSDLIAQKSSILLLNTSSNNSAAVNKMKENQSNGGFGFKPLGSSPAVSSVIFAPSGFGEDITIRLKSYKNMGSYTGDKLYSYRACIIGSIYGSSGLSHIPFRYGNIKSFDFFDYEKDDAGRNRDVLPVAGDEDYYCSASFSEENTYYVQLFAVGVAFDSTTLTNTYSLVLDLGSVPIKKDE